MRRWIALLFGLFGVAACSNDRQFLNGAPCVEQLDCRRGEVCGEAGRCVEVPPLEIAVLTLPDAVVGSVYSHQLAVTGGAEPYAFTLSTLPDTLSWLSIDPETGELSGTPSESSTEALRFGVQVADVTGQELTELLELTIRPCGDGEAVGCFVAQSGSCRSGTTVCDAGSPGGECEPGAPSEDLRHCGASCGTCPAERANRCTGGQCRCGQGQPCAEGQTCCGSGSSARCVDTASDSEHCGSCGNDCGRDGAAPMTCSAGVCAPGGCDSGFAPCDPSRPGECTTDIGSNFEHCGACDTPCDPETADRCVSSQCVCANDGAACSAGQSCCASSSADAPAGCADLDVGVRVSGGIARCGACDAELCADPGGNGSAVCTAGECRRQCEESETSVWADCDVPDGSPPESCDVDLMNDVEHCGACGAACPTPAHPDELALCVAGSCEVRCTPGSVDCAASVARTCSAEGVWTPVKSCAYGCEAGQCLPQCSPENAVTCLEGVRNRCSAGGEWVADPCPAGSNCTGDGVCIKGDGQPCGAAGECTSGVCKPRYRDGDADGHGGAAVSVCGASAPPGYVDVGGDCCDSDARARPGQTDFFEDERVGCGGYDFDCVDGELPESTNMGGCKCTTPCSCGCCPPACSQGWLTDVPTCGETADWVASCRIPSVSCGPAGSGSVCGPPNLEQRRMACR